MRNFLMLLLLLMLAGCRTKEVICYRDRVVEVHDTLWVGSDPVHRHECQWAVDSMKAWHSALAREAHVALLVVDMDSGDTLCAADPDCRMRTASTMKAVTAITALHTLGDRRDSAFTTRILVSGGKAWVRGGYDPLLGKDDVAQLVRQAAQKGVRRPLTADLSGQDTERYGRGWCWDDKNPLLTPLFYEPAVAGRKKNPIAQPERDCLDAINKELGRVKTSGMLSSASDTLSVASVMRSVESVMLPMLKQSDNLMAEATWRLTGNTAAERAAALDSVMMLAGTTGVWQADGSGLSLYNYATPAAMVALLRWADTQEWAPVLRQSLPLMGVDGTLKNRHVEGARIEAKTGTVDGVTTLVGYMTLATGRRLAFAVLWNGVRRGADARSATDALLQALATYFEPKQ